MLLALVLLETLLVAVATSSEPASVEDCSRRVHEDPSSRMAAFCFFELPFDDYEAAALELDELLKQYPDEGWLRYYRASVRFPGDTEGYREAAELFLEADDMPSAVLALANDASLSSQRGLYSGSEELLERAEDSVTRAEELVPQAEGFVLAVQRLARAHLLQAQGRDQALAQAFLVEAWEALEGIDLTAPLVKSLAQEILRTVIEASEALDDQRSMIHFARRAFDVVPDDDRGRERIRALSGLVKARAWRFVPGRRPSPELESELRELLELLEVEPLPAFSPFALRLAANVLEPEKAFDFLEQCVRVAREEGLPSEERGCELAIARLNLEIDRDEAVRSFARAGQITRQKGLDVTDGWWDWLEVLWELDDRDVAYERSLDLMTSIEGVRRLQIGDARARLASAWSGPYYWLAGRLLANAEGRDDVGDALGVLERLRAQSLRERLRSRPLSLALRLDDRWRELQVELSETYRVIVDPSVSGGEREDALARLARLERRESEVRASMEFDQPELEAPNGNALLEQTQEQLDDREALISFQLDHDRGTGGGAWVVIVTRNEVRSHRLHADRAEIEGLTHLFLDADPEHREAHGTRLAEVLLEPWLEELPRAVEHLVIVPDGSAHIVPFAMLAGEGEEPLVDRFALSQVPSIEIWLMWRSLEGSRRPGEVLVLANPGLPRPESSSTRNLVLEQAAELGDLPYAAREGRSLVRLLGGASELWLGDEASESRLKSTSLDGFGVVHFAAHALVDPARPGRSAVVLAGSGTDDGLLRTEEAKGLDGLSGGLVVLSACDSAGGGLARGEGVLGLASSFLEAGSHAVIGTLWPIDDREASEFFVDFYRELAVGATAGDALALTQRSWAKRNRDPAIWSSVVLVGDARLRPLLAREVGNGVGWPAIVLALVLVLALGIAFRSVRSSNR